MFHLVVISSPSELEVVSFYWEVAGEEFEAGSWVTGFDQSGKNKGCGRAVEAPWEEQEQEEGTAAGSMAGLGPAEPVK